MQDLNIKIGTFDDYFPICEMAKHFGKAHYEKWFPIEDYKIADNVTETLSAPPDKRIILLATNEGNPVGMLVARCDDHPYSTVKVASEVMWWMEPEFRKSRLALQLPSAFEYWAKNIAKADLMMLSTVDRESSEKVEKFYKRKGYSLVENGFIKKVI